MALLGRTAVEAAALRPQARRVSLLRLLLLSIALGIILFFENRRPELIPDVLRTLHAGLICLAALSAVLVIWVDLVRRRWQLALHLVFDVLWIGLLVYYTGGVASPAVVLLFAVVLIGNVELPGTAPFAMPALAALTLASNGVFYATDWHPFPEAYVADAPGLFDPPRILGFLAIQVAAMFLVDLLGQLLASRVVEQRLFTGELLDQLGEGVLAVDLQGTIVYANDEASRLLGLPPDAQGRAAGVALGALPEVLELLRAKGSAERARAHDGRQLVLRAHDLVGRRGRCIGRALIVADESRLRVLEDNARRAEQLAQLGEMAAGIAHEVRNPLTSLRGCAQELADICSKLGQGDAAALARIMVGESDRLARIVGDFLAMSRLRAPVQRAVAIGPVLDELRQLSRHRGDLPSGLVFVAEIEPGCPDAFADPDQLRQVLGNLVNNAFDAVLNVARPTVSVRARDAGSGNPLGVPAVEIVVVDNGCGIPPELHERVFAPFFSTKSQGTGLGLSLVSRIIREHEGALQLASGVDAGATVTIHLPVEKESRSYALALGTPAARVGR